MPRRRLILAMPAILAASRAARADGYPARPVRMVVPFTPGGGTDICGRLTAQALGDRLGQPVVVENRGGAGGNIGAQVIATAPPDGYNILFNGNNMAVNAALYRNPGYELKRDFVGVARVAQTPMLLIVKPDVPVRDLGGFIAYARAHPGELNHGTPGSGTAQHLAAVLFDDMAGTRITHVPYRGTSPSVAAMLSGEVQVMFASVSAVEELIRDGRVRALAVTSARRSPAWPDLPAIGEVLPGYAAELWYGIWAPAHAPMEAVALLQNAVRDCLADQAFASRMRERGFEPEYLHARALDAATEAERDRWEPVLRRNHISAD